MMCWSIVIWLWVGTGWGADALRYSAKTSVEVGSGHPSVTFEPGVSGTVDILVDCGVNSYAVNQAIAPGGSFTVPLTGLPAGQHSCRGEVLLVSATGETGALTFILPVALLPPLNVTGTIDDIDLDGHTLTLHANRELAEAKLQVFGPRGVLLEEGMGDLSDPLNPTFGWATTGEVVKLYVHARDTHGFMGFGEFSPWSYRIPHDDIIFVTGRADITVEEQPKLESTWEEIARVLELYGSVVKIELFVAGYTDTVGSASSNMGLSKRRARSIANWYRQRGFDGPVWYQGFGESALAVRTGDEVEEARNRRALYILAAQVPPVSEHLPSSSWTRID